MDELSAAFGEMGSNGTPNAGSDEKLIVALDFGTTYSGVSYCFASQRDPIISAVLHWPGSGGRTAPKVPTVIRYNKEDPTKFEWGASVTRDSDTIVGIKLLLDPAQEKPLYLPSTNAKRDLKSLPKPPVEIAADFIGAIYQHALAEISSSVPKAYFSRCQKDFVLSVPAVWSDAAKNATLRAAEIAGISPVTLIKEPEAAALYTAKSLAFSMKPKDAFVVCDAGGGTVDLVSYQVEAVLPRLQVKELVPGTGGMAGSLGLNKRFESEVSELVGEEQWLALRKSKAFYLAEKQFDQQIKVEFRGDPDEDHFVSFPTANLEDDPENGLESNSWSMTGKDLKNIFDPLVTDILRLIEQQVQSVRLKRREEGITGIFLVGGFGSSQYLKGRIQKHFPDIQVLQPNDAWAAIVKGAALSRMPREAIVTSTSSTRHYGVQYGHKYEESIDEGQPTYRSRDGTLRAQRIQWYIRIGDDLLRDQKIRFSFIRSIDENHHASDLVFRDELIECEDKCEDLLGSRKSPIHRSKGERIQINCVLTADVSGVPKSRFIKKTDADGKPYLDVHFDLVITLESALMRFSLEMDGEPIGAVDAKYN